VFTCTLDTPPEQASPGPYYDEGCAACHWFELGTFCCRRTSTLPHSTVRSSTAMNAQVGGSGLATKRLHPLARHLEAEAEVERREPSEAAHRSQPLVCQEVG
jgi:hypothetical protein